LSPRVGGVEKRRADPRRSAGGDELAISITMTPFAII
jgi:hypothetical protein